MPAVEIQEAAGPSTLKSTVKQLSSQSQSQNGDPLLDDNISGGYNLLEAIKEEELAESRSGDDEEVEEEEEIRSESCSIGECSSAEDDDETTKEDEVDSKQTESSLSSLDSLEDSLPIKRGLSNFYPGKSKSFTSLLNAANATAKDLVKPENPLNKRRRLLIAWSRNRRASCSSLVSIAESPLLQLLPPVVSECEEEEGEESIELQDHKASSSSSSLSPSPSERMRRDKEKRRPSLFTVTVAPAEADHHDHDPVLASISINKMALRSPGRSLSLSDLNQHAHLHAMTNLD